MFCPPGCYTDWAATYMFCWRIDSSFPATQEKNKAKEKAEFGNKGKELFLLMSPIKDFVSQRLYYYWQGKNCFYEL